MTSTLLQARRFLIPRCDLPSLAPDVPLKLAFERFDGAVFSYRIAAEGKSVQSSAPGSQVVEVALPPDLRSDERIVALAGRAFDISVTTDSIRFTLLDEERAVTDADGADEHGVPVPPGFIRQRYVGQNDWASFLNSGERVFQKYSRAVSLLGRSLHEASSIFDFGCGCGRIARHFLSNGFPNVIGFDLDPIGIKWTQTHLTGGRFELSKEWPPLDIPSESVDFAYAISVFTHLDEEHATAWMHELLRVLKHGAVFVATFRGTCWIEKQVSDAVQREELLRGVSDDGIVVRTTNAWKGIFPEFYQGTYHSYDYIVRRWGELFDVAAIMPRGYLDNSQDGAVLIKPQA